MREFINTRNPVLPLEFHIPDGEGHVMSDGRLYIYGSYDDRADEYCSEKYHVVATEDMRHWIIYDEALNGNDIPWFRDPDARKYPGIDWSRPTPFMRKIQKGLPNREDIKKSLEKNEEEKPALLFAPDCQERNGKYYLFFCMSDDSEGVVVSDTPYGPFKDPIQLPCGGIDPAIFIDDDGQIYYYWGQLRSNGVKLNGDMISFQENEIVHNLVTEEEHFFHEGSSMRKIGDTYYYVYADMERGKPTSLGYCTSKSPMGPFTYRGIIIDNDGCDPASWNNHGSIEFFQGQWYVFYHRCSRGTKLYRRLCIEPITICPDGSIPEVKMTSQGVGAPFAPGEKIMGYQACGLRGNIYIGTNEDNPLYPEKLMNIHDGDSAVFRYVKSEYAWRELEVKYRGSGVVRVFMDGKEAGTVTLQEKKEELPISCGALDMLSGEYEVILQFEETELLEIFEFTLR